jgi:tetratricopeptide (TPR) repeat protein
MSSKSTVMSRRDMKEPDKFQQAAGQAASWLASRKRHVVVAGAAAVAILVIVVVLATVQSSRTARTGAAASELLATVGAQVSAAQLPGEPGPTFPTEDAKQRAIVAAADRVIATQGGSGAAALAWLAKGDAHLRLHEWDAAKGAYEKFLASTGRDDSLRFGALEGIGMAAEGQGNLDAAAQAYARLAQEAPAFSDRADLDRARVLAAAGKTAEAKEILAAFGDRHKESSLTGEAADRLARLGGK